MTLDISLQAIEADLAIAERGGQVADLAMARAQVRATLLAASLSGGQGREMEPPTPVWVNDTGQDILIAEGPDSHVFTVPKAATWDDRVTAAAMLLGLDLEGFQLALGGYQSPEERRGDTLPLEPPATPPVLVDPTRITTRNTEDDPRNDDEPEDVFAEARKARKKR